MVDVTEQPDVAAQYGVWSLPTTIVLDAQRAGDRNQSRRGAREEIARAVGASSIAISEINESASAVGTCIDRSIDEANE